MNKSQLIDLLKLEEHREGGYFSETYRADETLATDRVDSNRNILTSIFYMLTDDRPIGQFHMNQSNIVHYYQGGSPLTYYTINPKGELSKSILGPNLSKGHCMQLIVNGGDWKATVLEEGEYGLLGEAVAPGFDYRDMALGKQEELVKKFPQHEDVIRRCTPS